MQSLIKGHIIRKKYPKTLFTPHLHQKYQITTQKIEIPHNNENILLQNKAGNSIPEKNNESEDQPEQCVQNFMFPNGAVYSGN